MVDRGELKDPWKVENDYDAEFIIEKCNEDLVEINRFRMSLENKVKDLMDKLGKLDEEEKDVIEKRDSYLLAYFETIDDKFKKKTKTQEKYRLPSGEIVKKYPGPEFKRDNDKLVKWFEDAKLSEFIETKKQAKWGEFKNEIDGKTVIADGNIVFKNTGEVVEGIEVIERPPVVEFKEV